MGLSNAFTMLLFWMLLTCLNNASMPEPEEYVLSFPTSDNPANMKVISPIEKNYFMLLGDWGAEAVENLHVQQAVADKMNAYYNLQASHGYNLLAVLSLGDNFYYTGQDCKDEYHDHWKQVYGPNLTDSIPWLAVYGNHDWGDSDFNAMCAFNGTTRYIDPTTKIPYAANQLNSDKGGCNPNNFYLPEFSYYYTVNQLDLEIIALEESCHACGDIGGGYGSTMAFSNCGGFSNGCNYLKKMANASEAMMLQRAQTSSAKNIILMQHYPEESSRLMNAFKDNRINNGKNDTIYSLFGHAHVQKCNGKDENGVCNEILSGGGGGCCTERSLRGFYVIGFDKNTGRMMQPLEFDDPSISCEYPCNDEMELTPEYWIENGYESCCHTHDADINCDLYDLTQCSAHYGNPV